MLLSSLQAQNPFKKDAGDLEARITENRLRLERRQTNPAAAIPAEVLNSARGIIIIHHIKAGLGIGAELGNGVALVKDARGNWGPPGFVSLSKGSWGLQIGADESVTFMVLMTPESLNILKGGGTGDVGISVKAVAGPEGSIAEAGSTVLQNQILVYSDAKGAFIGASLQAGALVEAVRKNNTVYRANLEQILFSGRIRPTRAGVTLMQALQHYSRLPY